MTTSIIMGINEKASLGRTIKYKSNKIFQLRSGSEITKNRVAPHNHRR